VATLREIVIDCEDAPALARFWASMLDGYDIRPYDDAEVAALAAEGLTPETDPTVMIDGPGPSVCLQQVPEKKTVKNRVHLDVVSADRRAEVERLVGLGASIGHEFDDWTLMYDPEGNEFCVADQR
jgi:hypothetical protein